MTVVTTESFVTYTGNGATTLFPFSFMIQTGADVVTVWDPATGSTTLSPSDYSITGLDNPAGGSVTYPLAGPALPSPKTITIQRVLSPVQETDISGQANFYSVVIEDALDYLTYLYQQLSFQSERALLVPVGNPETGDELVESLLDSAAAAAASASAASASAASAAASAASAAAIIATVKSAAFEDIGTSGHTVPMLDGTGNTWSKTQRIRVTSGGNLALDNHINDGSGIGITCVKDRGAGSGAAGQTNDALFTGLYYSYNNAGTPALIAYFQDNILIGTPAAGSESAYRYWSSYVGGANGIRFGLGPAGGLVAGNPVAGGNDKGVGTFNALFNSTAGGALFENGISIAQAYGGGYRNIARRNGGFEIWQRGAGGTASFAIAASAGNPYTADGWYFSNGANQASVVSQQAGFSPGPGGVGWVNSSQFCARVQRNNGETGVGVMSFGFPLDTDEIIAMRGQYVRLSFMARAGANWSPASGILVGSVYYGTGVPKKLATGFTGSTAAIGVNASLTTTATRFQGNSAAVIPTNASQMEVYFFWTPVGTAGAADYFELDDVQLEIVPAATGFVSTPFERLNFQEQLALCQRHYCKTFNYATAPAQNAGQGASFQGGTLVAAASAKAVVGFWPFPVQMRSTSPTVTTYNTNAANAEVRNFTAAADCSTTTVASSSSTSLTIAATGNAGGAVGDRWGVHITADAGI